MRKIYALAGLWLSATACSSGHVFLGEKEQDSDGTFTSDQWEETSIALSQLVPEITPATHEIFVDSRDETGPKVVLAMPRSADAQVWMITAGTYLSVDYWDQQPRFNSDCYEISRYSVEGVVTEQPPTLSLKKDSSVEHKECEPQYAMRLPRLPKSTTLREDLTKNTASINLGGTVPLKKLTTIDRDWEALSRDNAPPKLIAPVAYPTEKGFLLWGRNIDSDTVYASLYNHDDGSWTRLFGMDQAPTSDNVFSHTWSSGVLYVIAGGGLFTFDAETAQWTKADGNMAWPENVKESWSAVGDDRVLFVARQESETGDIRNHFYFFHNGWKELFTTQETVPYGQPLWDGKAFILWSPTRTSTEFLYPDSPDQLFTLEADDFSAYDGLRVTKVGDRIVRTHLREGEAGASYVLSENHNEWKSGMSFPSRNASVPASALTEDWHLAFGSLDRDLEATTDIVFYNSSWSHQIELEATGGIQPTAMPAVAWSHNRLFVWGGCKQFSGLRCVSYSSDGYVLKTFIRP